VLERRLLILGALLMVVAGCGNATGGPSAASSSPAGSPSAAPLAELPSLTLQASIDGFNGASNVLMAGDAIWVLEHSGATVTRIDPTTNKVTSRLVLGSGFANGLGLAGGRLWTFEQTAGQVIAIDMKSGKAAATVPLGGDGDSFWVGDDAAWILTGGRLVKIDGATAKTTKLPLDGTCTADGVAAGAGFVWLASSFGGLCKVDEATGATVARGSDTGNGSGIAIVGGRPWIAGADGGLSIVDPASLAVSTALPAPAGGTFAGAKYTIGSPGGESTVVAGTTDGKAGWVRNTGSTIGRVTVGATPTITLFAGLPAATLAGGVTEAFGSLWVTNFSGGTVERYALPTP
jgi:hypothetical protein